jgi:hypothetical protein
MVEGMRQELASAARWLCLEMVASTIVTVAGISVPVHAERLWPALFGADPSCRTAEGPMATLSPEAVYKGPAQDLSPMPPRRTSARICALSSSGGFGQAAKVQATSGA